MKSQNPVQSHLPCIPEKGTGDFDILANKPWNLLAEDVSLPAAVIYRSRWEKNLHWMQGFANKHSVHLAPHGKTTMIPDFFHQQMAAGAWGITLATATQVAVAVQFGVKKIFLANQLVGKQNMKIIAELPSDIELYCLIDSADNALQLGKFFAKKGRTLNVLIEIGITGGRCGCRTEQEAISLSSAIQEQKHLHLAGVEVYEGIIHGENAEHRVRQLLEKVVSITKTLLAMRVFDREQILLSGAGSAWYDLVCQVFHQASLAINAFVLIRPGCYLIHDEGIYKRAQSALLARLEEDPAGGLQPCLEVWSYVQSKPEAGLAIVSMGKRDVSYGDGLPQPALHYRPGYKGPSAPDPSWKTLEMMDQHTYLKVPENADLKVGDMLSFSISHPCLTFDKWHRVCIVNDNYEVLACVECFF